MTDRSKFEQMLEHLVNEDTEQAQELFHQIVVEKSREIYETILSEDFNEAKDEEDEDMDEAKDEDDEESVEEATDDDEEEVEEDFAFGEGDDEDDSGPVGGDPTDDMLGDIEASDDEDDMGDDMGGDEELEDRVVDLEDAIDDLRAEFEKMMGGEGDDEMDMGDDDMEMDMGDDDMDMKMGEEDDMFMREYVEKVGGADYTKYGKMGDNGVNTKSIVAGKNDMGGTSANIAKGGESSTGGTKGGLAAPTPKDMSTGNINVPGGNAGKTAFKKKEPGHGAEKKGSGDNGDKGAQSPINGVKTRAR
jgi:hypothetical protein